MIPQRFFINEFNVIDLDNDEDLDIIALDYNGQLAWFENDSENNFSGIKIISSELGGVKSLFSGNWNNNNISDVLILSDNNQLIWFENKNSHFIESQISIAKEPHNIDLKDINGDRILDVVLTHGFQIYTFLNQGIGELAPVASFISYETNKYKDWIVTRDIDGNGYPDLINSSYVFLNYGNENYIGQKRRIPDEEITSPDLWLDLNQDSVLDYIFKKENDWQYALKNYDGKDDEYGVLENLTSSDFIKVRDIDDDGLEDIIFNEYCENKGIQWFKNYGNMSFKNEFIS